MMYRFYMSLSLFFGVFFITTVDATERPIVVVIPSRNNESLCRENLESVFMQDYENYSVIYIEDASTDDTAKNVKEVISEHNQWHRCTLICNDRRYGQMYNHYMAVHRCPNDVIVVNLDGDDRLAHAQVLNCVNDVYQNNDVWMTYGQYKEWPSGKKGLCKKIPAVVHKNNAYRYFDWVTSHLRTFYAGLFKAIPIGYFLHETDFQPSAVDFAMMFSMLELSGGRVQFIDEVLYLYNCANPNNIFRQALLQQMTMAHMSRGRTPLKPLEYDPRKVSEKSNKDLSLAIILFATGPEQAAVALNSWHTMMGNDRNFYVLYQGDTALEISTYKSLCSLYPEVIGVDIRLKGGLKEALLGICESNHYSHVLPILDTCLVKENKTFDLHNMVRLLEKTHAIGFHLNLGKDVHTSSMFVEDFIQPPLIEVEPSLYVWKFRTAFAEWLSPYSLRGVVYNNANFCTCIRRCIFTHYTELEKAFSMLSAPQKEDVGLCYAESVLGA